ncbi:hypothetical protein DICSQDRAFT_130669, partial [Dichomitus squalens LYAD-421 SS1]
MSARDLSYNHGSQLTEGSEGERRRQPLPFSWAGGTDETRGSHPQNPSAHLTHTTRPRRLG